MCLIERGLVSSRLRRVRVTGLDTGLRIMTSHHTLRAGYLHVGVKASLRPISTNQNDYFISNFISF